MTGRELPEWVGKTPDTKIPGRVQRRVWEHAKGRCQAGCGRKLMPGDEWQVDHIKAVINGGENREFNLQVACEWCHSKKTKLDVAEKSLVARKRQKHIGIKKAKGRPMPGTKASGLRKRLDGTVERR